MNLFRWLHYDNYQRRSLAPIRYTACAFKGDMRHRLFGIKKRLLLFFLSTGKSSLTRMEMLYVNLYDLLN